MTPLYNFTADWTVDERRTAARLLAEAAGYLKVIAESHSARVHAKELADDINAALGLTTKVAA